MYRILFLLSLSPMLIFGQLPFNQKINSTYYFNRANAYIELGEYDNAIIDYTKAIELDSNWFVYYYKRASVYDVIKADYSLLTKYINDNFLPLDYYSVSKDLCKLAIADYSKTILFELSSDTLIPTLCKRAEGFSFLEEYKEAINDYSTIINLDPFNVKFYCSRGVVFNLLGEFNEAINDFNKVIELDSSHSMAYYYRANSLFEIGKYKESIDDINRSLEFETKKADYRKFFESYEAKDAAFAINLSLGSRYCVRGRSKQKLGISSCDDFEIACRLGREDCCGCK